MEKFNCTTPFGQEKTSICEDPSVAKQALKLLELYSWNYKGNCSSPCNYHQVKIILQTQTRPNSLAHDTHAIWLELRFQKLVKKVRTFYLYDFESLIAEIGGWVGLFLGMSVFQLASLFEFVHDRLKL